MNSIVIKNKTVKDAINLGLDLLQVSESEVDIEVVQPESNQFFGVHRKKAVVKLTKISKEAIKKSSVDDLMKDLLKSKYNSRSKQS
ncbi:Jag N-terminal domain-containing protein [Priestia flexa]|nr:Jag N-terminal domain-containing protein [Priestia flexa]